MSLKSKKSKIYIFIVTSVNILMTGRIRFNMKYDSKKQRFRYIIIVVAAAATVVAVVVVVVAAAVAVAAAVIAAIVVVVVV